MTPHRIRRIFGGVLLIVTLLVLAACRVQPGAAAFVGNTRISDAQVSQYLLANGGSSNLQGGSPRQLVVLVLVRNQLFRDYLQRSGAAPSPGALAAARDAAFQGQADAQLASLRAQAGAAGLQTSFADVFSQLTALEYLVIQHAKISVQQLPQLMAQDAPQVTLSPRYGSWNKAQLAPTGAAIPPYLRLNAPTAASSP